VRILTCFQQTLVDLAGIDFIGRLLAKEPTERMTLTDALEHDWLALPSSQHSEAPAYPLGGDSMYGIQDFDRSSSPSDSFEAAEWSRPMTASGTNLESGMGLADYREESVESDDSYSQKVQNIQLNSDPAIARSRPDPLTLAASNKNKDVEANGNGHENGKNANNDGSPPSPPLTAERIEAEASSTTKPANGHPEVPPTPSEAISHPERVETPRTATKRKALEVDLFASGSLSPPPPESIELPSPANSTHKPHTPQSEPSHDEQPQAGRGGSRTTRSSIKTPATTTTTPVARGRKSMRLA
jgi:serine/threonine protein kinase